jgi:hypothetical protein
MLILATTTDSLEIITSAVCDVDYYTSYMDASNASPPVVDQPGRTSGNITTATTTTNVIAAPGGTKVRNVKFVSIRNAHATTPVDITVQVDVSGTNVELVKMTLLAGDTLEYTEATGWFKVAALVGSPAVYNFSTAAQSPAASDVYVTNSNLLIGGRLKVGTIFRWNIHMTKTAAGTATPAMIVRFGTAGAVGDTARCTLAGPAQTAAVDEAVFQVEAVVWTYSATGTVRAQAGIKHSAAVAAGFGEMFDGVTSGTFDLTVAGLQVGLSMNPGASAAWTYNLVTAEAFNLAA